MEDFSQKENREESSRQVPAEGTGFNPYCQIPETPVSPYSEPKAEKPGRKKKKWLSGAGFLVLGMMLGAVLTSLLAVPMLNAYCSQRGVYVVLGGQQAKTVSGSQVLDDETVSKIQELQEDIDLYYSDEVTTEDLQDGILHGMVDGLGDPYSEYYTPEEYADLQVDTTGQYYGIGAGLSQDQDTMVVTISKVYAGTPAEEAGLLKGDIIVSADGQEATSMEVSDLVQIIRGEEGTTVHLEVVRDGESMSFDVERRDVVIPSVDSQMLEGDMGYIQVSQWQSNTSEEFKSAYEELEAQGMKGLIVDLRANGGGLLDVVVDCLDYILPEGEIVYTEDKYGNRTDFTSDASCIDIPMVVLVDGNTASASEIFAGAMQDYDYATLVGTTTFGKGIVQTLLPLSDGDAVKLTTAKYYTPKGNYIHGVGITPDVEIEYEWTGPEDATVYEMQYDNQLQKAIEVLGEEMAQ